MSPMSTFEKVLIFTTVVFLFVITYNKAINISQIRTVEISDTTPLSFYKISENSNENITSAMEKSVDKKVVAETSKNPAVLININTASAQQLMLISGIGEVLAQRIIEFRTQNGNFKSLEELLLVKGIGEGTFFKIKPFICIQ